MFGKRFCKKLLCILLYYILDVSIYGCNRLCVNTTSKERFQNVAQTIVI